MSGVACSPPALFFQDQIRGCCFFFSLFFAAVSFCRVTNTPSFSAVQQTGKRAYLPLLSRGQWRGVNLQSLQCFLSSIHCHCLLIGWLFGQPGVTGPRMWLRIPAFGACVISFNSSISQRRCFSLCSFVSDFFFFSSFPPPAAPPPSAVLRRDL